MARTDGSRWKGQRKARETAMKPEVEQRTMKLFEKYRPAGFDAVLGQSKVISQVRQLVDRQALGGNAYFISGGSGQGKTTIARLLAAEIASEFGIEEVDATGLTVGDLADLERKSHLYGMGDKTGRAFIVNEAHGLRKDVIRQLLVILERIPAHCVWIFTTTKEGKEALFDDYDDSSPLLSRCIPLALTNQGLHRVFAEEAQRIAKAENLDGRPIGWYLKLAERTKGNMRAMLQVIESGEAKAKGGE